MFPHARVAPAQPATPKQTHWLRRFAARAATDAAFLAALDEATVRTLADASTETGFPVFFDAASGALDACFAQPREARPTAAPVPADRVAVTGTILKLEWRDSQFGGSWKMTVRADAGYTLWGTRPAGLAHADEGARVSFTATLEPSQRDPGFGFIRRPARASVLDRPATDSAPASDGAEVGQAA